MFSLTPHLIPATVRASWQHVRKAPLRSQTFIAHQPLCVSDILVFTKYHITERLTATPTSYSSHRPSQHLVFTRALTIHPTATYTESEMVAGLEPLRAVPCTYPDCARSFDTLKKMKQHKVEDPAHFYCKKCDVDCESWVALTQHKVDSMVPYLHHGEARDKDAGATHIVCEFCGEEFNSFGGRKLHRQRDHRAAQRIVCPGCHGIFVRAALMIEHLELGKCCAISADEFQHRIRQKSMIKELLQNPVHSQSLYNLPAFNTETIDLTESGESTADGESSQWCKAEADGGVSLLDTNERAVSGSRIANREVDLATSSANSWRRVERITYKEKWPSLETVHRDNRNTESKGRADNSLSTHTWPSLLESTTPATAMDRLCLEEQTSRHCDTISTASNVTNGARGTHLDAWSKGKHTVSHASNVNDQRAPSHQSPWKKGKSTAKLFPEAKPTPPDPDGLRFLAQQDEKESAHRTQSRAKVQNESSAGFDPKRFYNSVINQYCCPYPACQQDGDFDSSDGLKKHLQSRHNENRLSCPACLKRFRKVSSLVAHVEAEGRCKMAEADGFMKVSILHGSFDPT